ERSWHLGNRKVFPNREVRDPYEPLRVAEHQCPDVVLLIFRHGANRAECSAVRTGDLPEGVTVVHCQPIVNADPQTARMILEQGSYRAAWQTIFRPDRRHVTVIDRIERAFIADPDRAVARGEHRCGLIGTQTFTYRETDDRGFA